MISSIVYREINLNNSTLFSLFVKGDHPPWLIFSFS